MKVVLGSTTPRLFTPPSRAGEPGPCGCGCALTPEDTLGFDVAEFAEQVLTYPLLPWQRWLVIHGLEHTDGIPRFRTVLVLVARQNGKTTLLMVLALYWLFIERVGLVLGTSTNLDTARESWDKAVTVAKATLSEELGNVRYANGEQTLSTTSNSRYKIAASNRRGGRGYTVNRLIVDELREHHDFDGWAAAANAMMAVQDGQAWALSNAGDDRSVVLNQFRAAALSDDNDDVGLFEWSAPENSELDDLEGQAQANPALGYPGLISIAALKAARTTQPPAVFRTENLCIRVHSMDQAVSLESWRACYDPGSIGNTRERIAFCLDISIDLSHATLCAAAVMNDGKVRVEVVQQWTSTAALRADLPDWIKRTRPRVLGFFPSGPTGALLPDLVALKAVPLTGAVVPQLCQGFSEQVSANQILQANDALLTAHISNAERLYTGDGWRFTRKGEGNVDAVYAASGAVHLARMQKPKASMQIIVAD